MKFTLADLFYYGGFIAGCGIGVTAMRKLGIGNNLVQVLVGIGLGIAVGYALERLHLDPKAQDPDL